MCNSGIPVASHTLLRPMIALVLGSVVAFASRGAAASGDSHRLDSYDKLRIACVRDSKARTLQEIAAGRYLVVYFWYPEKDGRFMAEWQQVTSFAKARNADRLRAIAVYPLAASGEVMKRLAAIDATATGDSQIYSDGSALLTQLSDDFKTPYAVFIAPDGRLVSPRHHLGFKDRIDKWLQELPEPVRPLTVRLRCVDEMGADTDGLLMYVDGKVSKSGQQVQVMPDVQISASLVESPDFECTPMSITAKQGMDEIVLRIKRRAVPVMVILGGIASRSSRISVSSDILELCASRTAESLARNGYEAETKPVRLDDPTVPAGVMLAAAEPVIVDSHSDSGGYRMYMNLQIGNKGSTRPPVAIAGSYFPLRSTEPGDVRSVCAEAMDELLAPAMLQLRLVTQRPRDMQWFDGNMSDGMSGRSKMKGENRATQFHGFSKHLRFGPEDRDKTLTIYSDAGRHLLRAEIWPGLIDKSDHEWWKRHDGSKVVFSAGDLDHVVVSNSPSFTWKVVPGQYTLFFCHYLDRLCPCTSERNFQIRYVCMVDGKPID